ncbi:hypothetical protein AK812_SmicGene4449 [Symbiodinium microadriaticum]|uniref:Ion transport domain-containing protein n=1 Tax=Symbiodinium microadriaticum TaxID=2951 RepID=A0A1Q9EWF5_SYMMI|nr:hypothetical protein AK812_SmicGene4449 [Symbiodinium microadriaticum]
MGPKQTAPAAKADCEASRHGKILLLSGRIQAFAKTAWRGALLTRLPKDPIPVLPEEDSGCCAGSLVIVSEGSPESGQLPRVRLRNREFEVIELVTWWAFDKCCSVCPGLTNPDLTELRIVRFILFLIFFNSICLASYDHRSESFNWVSDNIFDPILTSFFTLEFILKVIAFGFVVDKTSYLRDVRAFAFGWCYRV